MKLLLAALLALPMAALGADRPGVEIPPDDPPLDCPFCGGNVQLHARVVGALTATNAEGGRRALVAFWQ